MHSDDYVLISVDDHVVEPANMFEGHLTEKWRSRAPRIVTSRDRPESTSFTRKGRLADMGSVTSTRWSTARK